MKFLKQLLFNIFFSFEIMSHSISELFLINSVVDGTEDKASISFDFKLEDNINEEEKEEVIGDVVDK